jgi:hypothetical protein
VEKGIWIPINLTKILMIAINANINKIKVYLKRDPENNHLKDITGYNAEKYPDGIILTRTNT